MPQNFDDKITSHPVKVGQEFSNGFNGLCDFITLENYKSGKGREIAKTHLNEYMDWEQPDPSKRKIIITKVYYGSPRKASPKTMGIHTTAENQVMQDLIMLCPDIMSSGTKMTSTGILKHLKLKHEGTMPSERLHYALDLDTKVNDLLKTALIQLEKKKYISMREYNLATYPKEHELTPREDEEYHIIIQEVLAKANAKTIYMIYARKTEDVFWNKVNSCSKKRLGISDISHIFEITNSYPGTELDLYNEICDRYFDSTKKSLLLASVNPRKEISDEIRKILWQRLIDCLSDNYNSKHGGAVGVTSSSSYRMKLSNFVEAIQAEYP